MSVLSARVDTVAELHGALAEFVGERVGADVSVSEPRRMAGGTGNETWAFDVLDPAGLVRDRLVLRRTVEQGMLDGDPGTEFELLTALDRAGFPVPRPRWCVTEDSPLARPFIVVERLSGTDLRKHLARNAPAGRAPSSARAGDTARNAPAERVPGSAPAGDAVRNAPAERLPGSACAGDTAARPDVDRRRLGRRLVRLQAGLHRLVPVPGLDDSPPLDRWAEAIERATGDPGPLLATALDWLRATPPEPGHRCVVHGDFKTNNLVLGADDTLTVLDWELAHVGDPVEDLAWTMLWTTGFDLVGGLLGVDEYLAAYQAEAGRPVEPARLRYWRIFALVKLAAIFLTGVSRSTDPTPTLMGRAVHHIDAELGSLLPEALVAS
ncbi:phosphotransferase family protein [Pseudonocardia eucalypti]|uniref:Phosphotransferase family protein n=1 Tax=Pseudonocardia eucalypti TaxID=648755 RepID=A0ABP9QGV2_9PSEU|nr:aminoglycoside phosphotransferase (APT) family kinase protein [Pseudonocardia eucalypti]